MITLTQVVSIVITIISNATKTENIIAKDLTNAKMEDCSTKTDVIVLLHLRGNNVSVIQLLVVEVKSTKIVLVILAVIRLLRLMANVQGTMVKIRNVRMIAKKKKDFTLSLILKRENVYAREGFR